MDDRQLYCEKCLKDGSDPSCLYNTSAECEINCRRSGCRPDPDAAGLAVVGSSASMGQRMAYGRGANHATGVSLGMAGVAQGVGRQGESAAYRGTGMPCACSSSGTPYLGVSKHRCGCDSVLKESRGSAALPKGSVVGDVDRFGRLRAGRFGGFIVPSSQGASRTSHRAAATHVVALASAAPHSPCGDSSRCCCCVDSLTLKPAVDFKVGRNGSWDLATNDDSFPLTAREFMVFGERHLAIPFVVSALFDYKGGDGPVEHCTFEWWEKPSEDLKGPTGGVLAPARKWTEIVKAWGGLGPRHASPGSPDEGWRNYVAAQPKLRCPQKYTLQQFDAPRVKVGAGVRLYTLKIEIRATSGCQECEKTQLRLKCDVVFQDDTHVSDMGQPWPLSGFSLRCSHDGVGVQPGSGRGRRDVANYPPRW